MVDTIKDWAPAIAIYLSGTLPPVLLILLAGR